MLRSYDEVAEAIRKMVIRGAPAIGVAAAMGIALGASQSVGTSVADLEDDLALHLRRDGQNSSHRRESLLGHRAHARDVSTRQTPRLTSKKSRKHSSRKHSRSSKKTSPLIAPSASHGGPLIPDGATVLTHCNAGALATAGDYGTALGVIRGARDAGKKSRSSLTKRDRFYKDSGSLRGNSRKTTFRSPSSPTTWPGT